MRTIEYESGMFGAGGVGSCFFDREKAGSQQGFLRFLFHVFGPLLAGGFDGMVEEKTVFLEHARERKEEFPV